MENAWLCSTDGTAVGMEEKPTGREEILREAIICVCTDRNQQYGEPEDNFAVIAELWIPYIKARCVPAGISVDITATDVCNLMALFKIGRAATAETQKKDTYIDIAGYAACAGGMIE